eukprot:Opistho-2@41563
MAPRQQTFKAVGLTVHANHSVGISYFTSDGGHFKRVILNTVPAHLRLSIVAPLQSDGVVHKELLACLTCLAASPPTVTLVVGSSAANHARIHGPPTPCPVPDCSSMFPQPQAVPRHIRTMHGIDVPVVDQKHGVVKKEGRSKRESKFRKIVKAEVDALPQKWALQVSIKGEIKEKEKPAVGMFATDKHMALSYVPKFEETGCDGVKMEPTMPTDDSTNDSYDDKLAEYGMSALKASLRMDPLSPELLEKIMLENLSDTNDKYAFGRLGEADEADETHHAVDAAHTAGDGVCANAPKGYTIHADLPLTDNPAEPILHNFDGGWESFWSTPFMSGGAEDTHGSFLADSAFITVEVAELMPPPFGPATSINLIASPSICSTVTNMGALEQEVCDAGEDFSLL